MLAALVASCMKPKIAAAQEPDPYYQLWINGTRVANDKIHSLMVTTTVPVEDSTLSFYTTAHIDKTMLGKRVRLVWNGDILFEGDVARMLWRSFPSMDGPQGTQVECSDLLAQRHRQLEDMTTEMARAMNRTMKFSGRVS